MEKKWGGGCLGPLFQKVRPHDTIEGTKGLRAGLDGLRLHEARSAPLRRVRLHLTNTRISRGTARRSPIWGEARGTKDGNQRRRERGSGWGSILPRNYLVPGQDLEHQENVMALLILVVAKEGGAIQKRLLSICARNGTSVLQGGWFAELT